MSPLNLPGPGRSLAGVPADVAAEVSKGIAGALDPASDPASAALLLSAREAFVEAW